MSKSAYLLMDKKNAKYAEIVAVLQEFQLTDVKDGRTPSDALTGLRGVEPEVVVVDWDIAPLDRMTDFLQKFRKLVGKRSTPVVVCSNEFTQSLIAIASEYNVAKVMLKGTVKVALKPALQNILTESAQPSPIKSLLLQLDKALEKNVPSEIEQVIEEFYKSFPDHPRAQLEYGNLILRQGKPAEAQKLAEKALVGAPNNLRAMNLLSRALMHQGKQEDALNILQQAELVSPKNLDRLVLLGDCFYQQGDSAKARASYDAALEVDGESKDARKGLGVIELNEGDVNKALGLFRDSASEEELAGFFNNAAIVAVRAGDFEKGVNLYEAAKNPITSKPLLAKVFFNKGLAFRRWNKLDEAANCFVEATKLDPKHEKAKIQLEEVKKVSAGAATNTEFIRTPLFDMLDEGKPAGPQGTVISVPQKAPAAGSVTVAPEGNKSIGKVIERPETPKPASSGGEIKVKEAPSVNPFSVKVLSPEAAKAPPKAAPPAPAQKAAAPAQPTAPAGQKAPAPSKPAKAGAPAGSAAPKFFDDEDDF